MKNEIITAMEERWSIRKFKAEMPPKEQIEQIVQIFSLIFSISA